MNSEARTMNSEGTVRTLRGRPTSKPRSLFRQALTASETSLCARVRTHPPIGREA